MSPALFVWRTRICNCRLMAIVSCEPGDGQTGSVWFFAGGREIRISSLELAKFYSSRAHLKPSTGRCVLEPEIGDGARFLKAELCCAESRIIWFLQPHFFSRRKRKKKAKVAIKAKMDSSGDARKKSIYRTTHNSITPAAMAAARYRKTRAKPPTIRPTQKAEPAIISAMVKSSGPLNARSGVIQRGAAG